MSAPSTPKKGKYHSSSNVNNNFEAPSTKTWDDHLPIPKLSFTAAAGVVAGLALGTYLVSPFRSG